MSRISWDNTTDAVESPFPAPSHRDAEAVRHIVVRPAWEDDDFAADEKPGKCYFFDRVRRKVIEINSDA